MAASDGTSEIIRRHNFDQMIGLFRTTFLTGLHTSPRGFAIRELFDTQITISPMFPFQMFHYREYNVEYFKKEMLWKLTADRMNDSIKKHAKMWSEVQNVDGSFNSNYGYFWFGPQSGLLNAVLALIQDPDSRRAAIPMLQPAHLDAGVRDAVCTESVTFHIREGTLRMSVHMRSSDQVFGLGTDLPTFSVLYMLALGLLRDVYPWLQMGEITLTAASSHIYERHFKMVRNIIENESFAEFGTVELPEPYDSAEVWKIIGARGKAQSPESIEGNYRLMRFIYG